MGRISPGPTRWPPGAERRLVPTDSNLTPQTPLLPLWGAACGSLPCPPSRRRRILPRVRVRSWSRGRPVHRVRPAWRGGGGGAARGPLPRGPLLTRNLPLPSRSGQHCGCHWRCSGHGGRGPHTVLVRRRVPPPGVVRAPLRRAGAGSPIGRDPRGSRRLGAQGRAVCRSSCPPPPPRVAVPSGGGGASPRLRGGEGSALVRPSSQGGGAAPPPPAPPPRRVSACYPLSPARAPGVYSCCGGCRAAVGVGHGPVGHQRVSAAGGGREGGSDLLALVCAPAFPRPASEGAAPFALFWAPLVRRRSVAGRAGACGRSTGGACHGRGAPPARRSPPPAGVRGRCLSGLPPSALVPEGGGGRGGGASGPLAPPPHGRGGRPGGSGPGGPAVGWGVALFLRPSLPCESQTLVQALAGVPCSFCCHRAALVGWGRP